MARYERDFIGRVRGMWNRIAGDDDDRGPRPMMDAAGPGAEGYYLSREMAQDAEYNFGRGDVGQARGGGYDRGYGMAQFGRAGRGRGYGGDYQTGRGGPDRDEFFVNRRPADSGYAADYGAEYGGFPMGYDRGYRAGRPTHPEEMDSWPRGYYSGTARGGGVIGQTSSEPGLVYPPEQRGRYERPPYPRSQRR